MRLKAGGFVLVAVSIAAVLPAAQPECAPVDEAALRSLLANNVPAAGFRRTISSCGIDLGQADQAAAEAKLKEIGVPSAALTVLSPPTTAVSPARWTSPFDRRDMVFIPGGTYRMGSPSSEANRDADETSHEVTLNAFWIDAEEVTNAAFQKFVISRSEWRKGNVRPEYQSGSYLKDWDDTNFPAGKGTAPVTWVSWHAARAYAAWAGKRLATEAEWEYSARASATSRYWWGADFDARRVAGDTSLPTPEQAQLRTNLWGARDTIGGVWEWTSSLYRPYPYRATDGREDPRAPGMRSIRGGSRANGDAFLRVANRNMEEPVTASDLLGFRCAR